MSVQMAPTAVADSCFCYPTLLHPATVSDRPATIEQERLPGCKLPGSRLLGYRYATGACRTKHNPQMITTCCPAIGGPHGMWEGIRGRPGMGVLRPIRRPSQGQFFRDYDLCKGNAGVGLVLQGMVKFWEGINSESCNLALSVHTGNTIHGLRNVFRAAGGEGIKELELSGSVASSHSKISIAQLQIE